MATRSKSADAPRSADPAACIVGRTDARLWGMSSYERLRRSFYRAGVTDVQSDDRPPRGAGTIIAVRGDYVFDDSIIAGLVAQPGVILEVGSEDGGRQPVAAHLDAADAKDAIALLAGKNKPKSLSRTKRLAAEEAGSIYREDLRKRDPSYVIALGEENLREIEWRMFKASYKGVTDVVTKYVWPVPAFWATRWSARLGLSPNFVTTVSLVFVLAAYFLFARGDFLLGLAAGWIMTFLDTVDGKLARVTLVSSKFGNLYDHGIDLIHPPFWYWAWAVGLAAGGNTLVQQNWDLLITVLIGGYVLGRVVEGIFLHSFKMQIHIWRRVDSVFRTITARRNPNMVLLTLGAIAGRPDLGLVAVAVWTALSLAFHCLRLVQGAVAHRRGALVSWLTAPVQPQ